MTVSRNNEFEHGHTPLSGYLAFAQEQPTHATAREIYQRSIPADTGLVRGDDGRLHPWNPGDTPMSPSDVMTHKYDVASSNGVRNDVLARGVVNPLRMVADGANAPRKIYDEAGVTSGRPKVPLLWNGQHRLAVMLKHDPDTPIPLEWGSFDQFEEAGPRINKKYNEKIPSGDKPVTLPKRVKKPKK